jgi:hypothetical protein
MKADLRSLWKTFRRLILTLPILGAVCFADSNVQGIVVAEQTELGARLRHPTPAQPAFYVAYDGGYIESGRAIGGLEPPAASVVGRALRAALDSAGYQAAGPQTPPSLVLIYHWGYICPELTSVPNTNLEARLFLVAPSKMVRQVEEFLANGHLAKAGYVAGDVRDTFDFAHGNHYFLVVSAFDFADLTRETATLLWVVKLNTQDNSGLIGDALPALIESSGPYLGCNYDKRQFMSAPLQPRAAGESAGGLMPNDATGRIDAGVIRTLIQREGDFLSGTTAIWRASNPPSFPPALAQDIAAYRQEKAALQGALAEKIKSKAPGPETRRAIDVFNEENSARIAALGRMGESIRSKLALLRTGNSPPADERSLDALLGEFAAEVRQLEQSPRK